MRDRIPDRLEKGRVLTGPLGSPRGQRCGMYVVPSPVAGSFLCVLCSDGSEAQGGIVPPPAWEHVSVSVKLEKRCPTWSEMCHVKDLFWAADEVVVQYHPAEADYVSYHDYCLHLWKQPAGVVMPTPPSWMVGPKGRRVSEDF